jgi:superfamily II DNA or RNA helicase
LAFVAIGERIVIRLTLKENRVLIDKDPEDDRLYRAIKEYFSYVTERGRFTSRAFRGLTWENKASFLRNGRLPSGFFPKLTAFLRESGADFSLTDARTLVPRVKSALNLSGLGGFSFREYQAEMIRKTLTATCEGLAFPCGVLNAATNAGKNLTVAGIFDNLDGGRMLFLLHSVALYDQAVEYFSRFFEVGRIDSRRCDLRPFTVAMYKALANRMLADAAFAKAAASGFEALVVDECHRSAADSYVRLLSMFDAGMRIGVSGTPFASSDKVKALFVYANFGPVIHKVENRELIAGNVSRKPVVVMLLCPPPPQPPPPPPPPR